MPHYQPPWAPTLLRRATRTPDHALHAAHTARLTRPRRRQAYWLFVATLLIVLTVPSLVGRCDLYPATTLWERLRWDASELLLLVLLLAKVRCGDLPH